MRRLKVLAFAATLLAALIVSPAAAWAEGEDPATTESTESTETTPTENTESSSSEEVVESGEKIESTESTEEGSTEGSAGEGESVETTSGGEEEVVLEYDGGTTSEGGATDEELMYFSTMETVAETLVVEDLEIHNLDRPGEPLVAEGEHGTATITLRNDGDTTLTGVTATASWTGLQIQQQATFPDIEPGATVVSTQPLLFSLTGEGLDQYCPRSVQTSDVPEGEGDVSPDEGEGGIDEGTEGETLPEEGGGNEGPIGDDPGTGEETGDETGEETGEGDETIPEEEAPPLLHVTWEGGSVDAPFPGTQVCALFSGSPAAESGGAAGDGDENEVTELEVTELAATGTTSNIAVLGAMLLLAGAMLRRTSSRRPALVAAHLARTPLAVATPMTSPAFAMWWASYCAYLARRRSTI